MIYFDNAATTMKKPQEVISAVTEALCSVGNAGRGVHEASLDASRLVFDTRAKVAELFHAKNPRQIVFTMNSTESLNIAIKGILNPGDHVITTAMEHNSVLRPLYEMEEKGICLTILPCDKLGNISYDELEKNIRKETRAVICTHASNVTGNVIDIERVGSIVKKHGILLIVDASQTAGILPLDVEDMNIDVLCFTGHKGLLGPQGTGGMYVKEGLSIRPLITGGSGVQSYSRQHPQQMPTALEAGTMNIHGLAGLNAAIGYIKKTGKDVIYQKEKELMHYFYEGVKKIPGVTIYGDFECEKRCAIVSLNIRDYDSSKVSDVLFDEYGICTRAGAHCAPLMHESMKTIQQGVVRFSFSHYNTKDEVQQAIAAIKEIAQ